MTEKMKRIFLLAALATAISSNITFAQAKLTQKPLAAAKSQTLKQVSIPFKEAESYFTNNNAKPGVVKIVTQEAFDKYFGAAATMKSSGTKIDFSKQIVLAVIGQQSKNMVSLEAKSVTKKADGTLVLLYRKHVGKKQGYSSLTSLILVVDKQTAGPGELLAIEIK